MLIKTLIVHIFGANSQRPKRKALVRLLAAFISSACIGVLFWLLAAEVPRGFWLPQDWVSMLLFGSINSTLCVILLVTSGTFTPKIQEISKTLPLTKTQKIAIYFTPQILLVSFSFCAIGPALLRVANGLELSLSLSTFTLLSGILSAFGIVYGTADWRLFWRCFWGIGLITMQILCARIYPTLHGAGPFIVQALFWSTASLAIVRCVHIPQILSCFDKASSRPFKKLRPSKLARAWLLLGYTRNKGTILSFLTGMCLSLGASLFAAKEHLDPAIIYTVLSLLIGAAIADIRGMQHVKFCFGIVALQGTLRFMLQHILVGTCAAALLTLPLLTYLASLGLIAVLNGISYGFLGFGIGIGIGTIIVPQNKDISSQLYASLLIIVATLGMQRYMSGSAVAVGNIFIGCILLLISAAIEQYRNNFIWRKI